MLVSVMVNYLFPGMNLVGDEQASEEKKKKKKKEKEKDLLKLSSTCISIHTIFR